MTIKLHFMYNYAKSSNIRYSFVKLVEVNINNYCFLLDIITGKKTDDALSLLFNEIIKHLI